MRLIKAKAFSMAKGNYSDTEDLVQEGFLGFMNAVSAYNPSFRTVIEFDRAYVDVERQCGCDKETARSAHNEI